MCLSDNGIVEECSSIVRRSDTLEEMDGTAMGMVSATDTAVTGMCAAMDTTHRMDIVTTDTTRVTSMFTYMGVSRRTATTCILVF